MRNLLVKPPILLRKLYPKALWRVATSEKKIYFTFDDGPIPTITPRILDILKEYNAKATFFCVGENIVKYPTLFDRILTEGHTVGNHSYNHVNSWKVSNADYLANIEKCQELYPFTMFRPPYGKMRLSAYRELQKKYKIVLWDILTMDYSASISNEQCYLNATNNYGNGSILVFHDNIKAEEKIKTTLPKVLQFYTERGFLFDSLT
ncbi:MAG: polysaccharide deacetylase family protein [Bacteroidetes bacterium]|nr:polysaccharide deacetylase family protein [Bacteroidota bacterium]